MKAMVMNGLDGYVRGGGFVCVGWGEWPIPPFWSRPSFGYLGPSL